MSCSSFYLGLVSGLVTGLLAGLAVWYFQVWLHRRIEREIDEQVADDSRLNELRSAVDQLLTEYGNQATAESPSWWRRELIRTLQRIRNATPERTDLSIRDASTMGRMEQFAQATDQAIEVLDQTHTADRTADSFRSLVFDVAFPLWCEGRYVVSLYEESIRSSLRRERRHMFPS